MERQEYSKNKHKMVRSEMTGDKNKKRKKTGWVRTAQTAETQWENV